MMDQSLPAAAVALPAAVPAFLQTVLLPGLEFAAPEDMYARGNAEVRFDLRARVAILRDGGHLRFDTFFNGLTVDIWRRVCGIDELSLTLSGAGDFILRFGLHRIGHAHRWLDEQRLSLDGSGFCTVPLTFWRALDGGMLYFTLEALGDAQLHGGYFKILAKPPREVKLGIVITHFNRLSYVLPAIARLRDELLSDPFYRDRISLTVIDNSGTIPDAAASGIRVIRNRNLGGTGGFMRGLLALIDAGGVSHCLFMDDDAACEIDSIRRAYALLQFAETPKFAVAGALLRQIEPFRLFEKGARFDGRCQPLKNGLDMRRVEDLLWAEFSDQQAEYGGWWFFAFAIADVARCAFPFFVRGDDIQFSMLNELRIQTMNGVACWGDDFGLKSGPLPIYFDVRNHIIQNLCVRGAGRVTTAKMIARFFLYAALSYNYGTAKAVTLAMADVAKGPEFWLENLDMEAKRRQIAVFAAPEKMAPVRRAAFAVRYQSDHETRRRRWCRLLTLNGFLLPGFMLKDDTVFQHKSFAGTLRVVFRFRRILYEYEPTSMGYVANHDKKAFFVALFDFARGLAAFVIGYGKLRDAYARKLPELTSEGFWRRVYDLEK